MPGIPGASRVKRLLLDWSGISWLRRRREARSTNAIVCFAERTKQLTQSACDASHISAMSTPSAAHWFEVLLQKRVQAGRPRLFVHRQRPNVDIYIAPGRLSCRTTAP
jgi:hypothetical protein